MRRNSLFNTGLNFKLYLIVSFLWVKELCLLYLPQSLKGQITKNSEKQKPVPYSITFKILFMATYEYDLCFVSRIFLLQVSDNLTLMI